MFPRICAHIKRPRYLTYFLISTSFLSSLDTHEVQVSKSANTKALPENDYSEFALDWLIEELAEDGDEIVCLRVVSPESKMASDPNVQQGIYKEEASSLLASIQKKNEGGKAISLVLELAVGKVSEVIQRMVCSPFPGLMSLELAPSCCSDTHLTSRYTYMHQPRL